MSVPDRPFRLAARAGGGGEFGDRSACFVGEFLRLVDRAVSLGRPNFLQEDRKGLRGAFITITKMARCSCFRLAW